MDEVGDRELDAPNGEAETIEEVLERCSEDEFDSADRLYDALVSLLSDAYIGRKYYDDRGSQPGQDEEEVSF